jgi:hypothetical protein
MSAKFIKIVIYLCKSPAETQQNAFWPPDFSGNTPALPTVENKPKIALLKSSKLCVGRVTLVTLNSDVSICSRAKTPPLFSGSLLELRKRRSGGGEKARGMPAHPGNKGKSGTLLGPTKPAGEGGIRRVWLNVRNQ